MNLGIIIKRKRLEKSLSQADLAYGICSQSTICNIENNSKTPNALMLFEISKKLSINFEEMKQDIEKEINVFNEISKDIYFEEYESAKCKIIKLKKKLTCSQSDSLYQELYFTEGIIYYFHEKKFKEAEYFFSYSLEFANFAPIFTHLNTLSHICLCNLILKNINALEINFAKVQSLYKKIISNYSESEMLKSIDSLYSYQFLLHQLSNYQESILVGKKLFELLKKNHQSLYVEKVAYLLMCSNEKLKQDTERFNYIEIVKIFSTFNSNDSLFEKLLNFY